MSLVLVLAGCSSDANDEAEAPAGRGGAGAAGAAGQSAAGGRAADSNTKAFGRFTIELKEELAGADAYATVSGQLFDADTTAVTSKLDTESGDCSLLVPDFPACGACEGVCVADGDCQPAPTPIDGGELVIEGIRGGDITLVRDRRMFFYQAPSALEFPPCEEGADVTLTGGGLDATTACIAPLALTTPEPIVVKTGSAVRVEWAPPGDPSRSRIQIKLDISHHGGKKGEIRCDVPDRGLFELPEPLVSKLVSLGVAAQPTIGLRREATAQASGKPGVTFAIVSSVERAVDTGYASCLAGQACPTGTACEPNTKVCR
jgi:hypothetical protein